VANLVMWYNFSRQSCSNIDGANDMYCYESHSPNKFLMVVYGDSIVNGISCHHRGYTMSDLARAGPYVHMSYRLGRISCRLNGLETALGSGKL